MGVSVKAVSWFSRENWPEFSHGYPGYGAENWASSHYCFEHGSHNQCNIDMALVLWCIRLSFELWNVLINFYIYFYRIYVVINHDLGWPSFHHESWGLLIRPVATCSPFVCLGLVTTEHNTNICPMYPGNIWTGQFFMHMHTKFSFLCKNLCYVNQIFPRPMNHLWCGFSRGYDSLRMFTQVKRVYCGKCFESNTGQVCLQMLFMTHE